MRDLERQGFAVLEPLVERLCEFLAHSNIVIMILVIVVIIIGILIVIVIVRVLIWFGCFLGTDGHFHARLEASHLTDGL